MGRAEKQENKFFARKFLEFMGYEVLRLWGRTPPYPDVLAVIAKGTSTMRVAVELTKYHVDVAPSQKGGSPCAQLATFWREVQKSLFRRLYPRRPRLTLDVHVSLKEGVKTRRSEARDLAAELVQFAEENAPNPEEHVALKTFSENYPLMQRYMGCVSIRNVAPGVALDWQRADVAFVGVRIDTLTERVETKTRKCGKYRWGQVDERWLLMYATGGPAVSGAGPGPQFAQWHDPKLMDACRISGFDKIYFYERVRQWYQQLWPH